MIDLESPPHAALRIRKIIMVNAAVTRKNLATVTRTATKTRVVRVAAQAESSSRRQVRVYV